jgi:hypothetical protein
MLTIIFSWVVLFTLISLVGRLFINKVEWYEYFWMGLVAVFAILQIWSIILPVNIYALLFVVFLACVSATLLLRKGIRLPKINIKFLICTGLILFAISYFASLSGGWPDTYGYHLSAVKWINMYKVVPGLANLYTRLGFNSSFFLFASMIDNLFLKDRSSHVALSLMSSVLSIEFLWIFLKSKSNHLKIFLLLSLPVFVEGMVHSVQVSSLSYDFALLIVILVICIELIKKNIKSLFIAIALCMMLVTIKLSGAVFALTIVLSSIFVLAFKKQQFVRTTLFIGLVGLVLVIPYVIRNIILSGWPLYPLPLFKFNFFWAMPRDRVVDLFNVIKGWAILPGSQWHTVIGVPFLQWFPSWFLRNINAVEFKIFFLTLVFFVASIFFGYFNKKTIKENVGLMACGVASFVSIIYLIFSAPDFRFGSIYFWVFFASTGSFLFTGLLKRNPNLIKILIAFSIFLSIYISWPLRLDSELMLRSIRWDQPGTTHQVLIMPKDGSPSFMVSEPESDSSCGNTELPCTSEPSNYFKEIVPGNIFSGFTPVN